MNSFFSQEICFWKKSTKHWNPRQGLQQQRAHAKNFFDTKNEIVFLQFSNTKCYFSLKQKDSRNDKIERSRIFSKLSEGLRTTTTQLLNTLNWENLSFHDKRQCTESVAPRQFSAHLSEQHQVQNDQLDSPDYGLVSSVIFIWRLFVSVSPSVLFDHSHSSSSLLKPPLIFFQWFYFHSNTLQGCIHRATVIWQINSCSIVGWVLRPSLVGHELELFTVVPIVLFVSHESGGDSIKSLSCFSTIFLGSSTDHLII